MLGLCGGELVSSCGFCRRYREDVECVCVWNHDTQRQSRTKKMLRCVVRAMRRWVLLVCFCVHTSERMLDCIFILCVRLCPCARARACACLFTWPCIMRIKSSELSLLMFPFFCRSVVRSDRHFGVFCR